MKLSVTKLNEMPSRKDVRELFGGDEEIGALDKSPLHCLPYSSKVSPALWNWPLGPAPHQEHSEGAGADGRPL